MNSPVLSPPEEPSAAKPKCRVIAKRYRIDQLLAEGGMALVYRGWHLPLDEPIAIKILKQDYAANEEAVTRFLQEARAGALLRGKNVAQVLDIGRLESGPPFMVTELLQGHDLQELLDDRGRLPVSTTLRLVKDICSAVADIHQSGIVHRDLKPANIFVARDGNGEPLIKLLDFGIAKRLDGRDLNDTKNSLGSPHYMAPEQIVSAEAVGVHADIWSLGIVLFELLTGRVPFDAATVPAQCAQVLQAPCPAPSEFAPEIPAALDAVILRCLEKEPQARFSSALELRDALEACEPHPVVASEQGSEIEIPITICLPVTETSSTMPGLASTLPPPPASVKLPLAGGQRRIAGKRGTARTRERRGTRLAAAAMAACAGLLTLGFSPTRDAAERVYGATEEAAQRTYHSAARALGPQWQAWFLEDGSPGAALPAANLLPEAPRAPEPRVLPARPEPMPGASAPTAKAKAPKQLRVAKRVATPHPAAVRRLASLPLKQPDAIEQRYALPPASPTTPNTELINPYPDMQLK